MAIKRGLLACALNPTFVEPIDVITVLRSYHSDRFIVRLIDSRHDFATGELFFRYGTNTVPHFTDSARTDDDVVRHTANEIMNVLSCEKQLRNGPLSFSYVPGTFEFSKQMEYEEGTDEMVTNRDEGYCEIAARRLQQEVLPLEMPDLTREVR